MHRPGLTLALTAVVVLLGACATQSQTKRSTYCDEITNNDADFGRCLHGNYPRGRKKALAAAAADNAARESKESTEQKRVAILPLDTRTVKAKLSDDSREAFDDALRETVSFSVNKAKWSVISAEDTVAGYTDSPPAKCVALQCQLAVAKEIKADVIVTGAVLLRAPKLVAAVTLIDVASGETLASIRVDGKNASALRTALEEKATEMIAGSDLSKGEDEKADPEQAAPARPQKRRAAEQPDDAPSQPIEAEPAPAEGATPGSDDSQADQPPRHHRPVEQDASPSGE